MEKLAFVKCEDHEVPMNIVYPDEPKEKYPCMLLVHGFLSCKNGDGFMLKLISEALAASGIVAARIDLVSMGENLYSRENYGLQVMLKETRASFEYLQSLPEIDENRVGLMGHSLGGRVVFLSSNLPSRLLVSLNGAINVDENLPMKYSQEDFDRLGYTINRTSDGRVELLYPRFFEEMKTTLSRDIYDYRNPVMVCVGTGDPTLDPNVSYNFINNCNMDNVEHIFIEGANHTFHAKTRDYTLLNQLIDRLVPWIADRI
ncbi:MAG: alpha/beta hydrolase [Erysipelotrichaceae bacterium]|nr:alpha/beta hydrolase [Erysipelotrichaceae bacterium]